MPPEDQSSRDIGVALRQANSITVDFNAHGTTGLQQSAGYIYEDPTLELRGTQQRSRLFKEMLDTDPTVGAVQFIIQNAIRGVQWKAVRASDKPADREAAEFLDSCMRDMDVPWSNCILEMASSIFYGFSVHEILWKRRAGRHSAAWMDSRYADGRLGLRGLPIRGQDSIAQWIFDASGHAVGCVQYAWNVPRAVIEGDKFLLFTQGGHKGNPEGLGLCRRLVGPYQKKKALENIESIGCSRDLVGLPIARVNAEVLDAAAGSGPDAAAARATVDSIREIVTRVRRDKLEGVVFPSQAHPVSGKEMYEFGLLTSGGTRNFNLNEAILRVTQEMYRSVSLDMMVLAQMGATGSSQAIISDKRSMFSQATNGFLGNIAETLNRQLVPLLMRVNGFACTDYPAFEHEALDDNDVASIAQSLQVLAQAGMPLFPNPELERTLLEWLGLPAPARPDIDAEMAARVPAATAMPGGRLLEVPNEAMREAGITDARETDLPAASRPKDA